MLKVDHARNCLEAEKVTKENTLTAEELTEKITELLSEVRVSLKL